MAKFFVTNANGGTPQSMSTAFKTLLALFGTTSNLRRIYIEELMASASDVPNANDCPINLDLSLMTADGTGTASAAQPSGVFETGTQLVAATTCKANYTAEPTVTASTSRLIVGPNQRSVFRWAALSDAHRPSSPGLAAAGFVWRAKSPNYASTMNADATFDE